MIGSQNIALWDIYWGILSQIRRCRSELLLFSLSLSDIKFCGTKTKMMSFWRDSSSCGIANRITEVSSSTCDSEEAVGSWSLRRITNSYSKGIAAGVIRCFMYNVRKTLFTTVTQTASLYTCEWQSMVSTALLSLNEDDGKNCNRWDTVFIWARNLFIFISGNIV